LQISCIAPLFNDAIKYINPTGKFVIGGPHGDTGLTGRKIIVDDVWRSRRWWCFSEKIQVKWIVVPLMLHVILQNLVAAGVADEILVQVSYAIGFSKPMGIFIDTTERQTKLDKRRNC
jgi:S-adenosylmethionine synthetase